MVVEVDYKLTMLTSSGPKSNDGEFVFLNTHGEVGHGGEEN